MNLKIKDFRSKNHYTIDNEMIDDEWIAHLGTPTYAVYSVYCRHANIDTGCSFPSYPRIAQKTGLSEREVIRCVQRLEKCHLIQIVSKGRGRGHSTTVCLLDKSEWVKGDTQSPIKKGDTQSPKKHTEKVTMVTQKGDNGDKFLTLYNETNITATKLRKEREEKTAHADTPNEAIYRKEFPSCADKLTVFQREQLNTLPDSELLRQVCQWWHLQGYKPLSIGRIIERYHEQAAKGRQPPAKRQESNYEAGMRILGLTPAIYPQAEVIQ